MPRGHSEDQARGPRLWETAMSEDILLTVDYHDQNCVIRRRGLRSGQEQSQTVPTSDGDLLGVVRQARTAAGRGGRVIWVQESTTGWARVQALLGERVEFVLANVLQMPLPPKGRRRKTDRIDTARMQREYLNGELPRAHQPSSLVATGAAGGGLPGEPGQSADGPAELGQPLPGSRDVGRACRDRKSVVEGK